jgi:SAM-dependent methyltransferase
MKLSELISYLAHLETFDLAQAQTILHRYMSPVVHSVTTHEIQLYDLSDKLVNNLTQVQTEIQEFNQTLDELKKSIQALIAQVEPSYFGNSYQLYDQEMRFDSAEHVLNRQFKIDTIEREYLLGRIMPYSDWRFPGLIIRPGREEWIDHLVGLDPLYIVDESWELMDHIKEKFHDNYINRLRMYQVDEYRGYEEADGMLPFLPEGQFGFCLAYNFFNYKPFEVMKIYLRDIYHKLRPGGTIALTFNDCSRAGGVALAERNFACYTPAELVYSMAVSLGFEIKERHHLSAAVTWLELTKPGELATIRGGQALSKPIAE